MLEMDPMFQADEVAASVRLSNLKAKKLAGDRLKRNQNLETELASHFIHYDQA
jgi:hypothetical protein